MMLTRKHVFSGLVVLGVAVGAIVIAAQADAPLMRSSAFGWDAVEPKTTDVGAVRQYFRAPTATLKELEYHATTLKPGLSSHAPHRHANEELVIVKEGTVEALVNGNWQRLGPGAVIFNASNELHAIRNVGDTPATYHVINWTSSQTPAR